MEFQELNRTVAPNEVRSIYTNGNLTINLTSRFNDNISLEDAIYQIVLQRLLSQNKPERRQDDSGIINKSVVQ